jgi:carboxymethylenebutenolidase
MTDPLSPEQQKMLAAYEFHTGAEFVTHRTEDALASMVADPYVALLPALTGGNGVAEVEDFYQHHFIFNMPPDMELVPVNRIVGAEHIVEESVFRFTHTVELDWMLPGLAPTGRRVEIAVVSIVKMEGEKLAHEHIYWDQASVLAQLGLLDADALPVVGADGARKILDRNVPVNHLMKRLRAAKGADR